MKKCYLQKQTRNQLLLLDFFCTQPVLDALKPRGNYPKQCWHMYRHRFYQPLDHAVLFKCSAFKGIWSPFIEEASFFPCKVKSTTGWVSSVQLHCFTWNFCRARADLHRLPKRTQVSIDIGIFISNSQFKRFGSTHDVSFTIFFLIIVWVFFT